MRLSVGVGAVIANRDTTEKAGNNRENVGYANPPKSKRFKPGNNANPKGRPKGTSLTAIIRRVLAEKDPKGKGTKADRLIAMAEARARKGDFRFFKELIDRNDGKVPDRIADADGNKLTIEVIRVPSRADSPN